MNAESLLIIYVAVIILIFLKRKPDRDNTKIGNHRPLSLLSYRRKIRKYNNRKPKSIVFLKMHSDLDNILSESLFITYIFLKIFFILYAFKFIGR